MVNGPEVWTRPGWMMNRIDSWMAVFRRFTCLLTLYIIKIPEKLQPYTQGVNPRAGKGLEASSRTSSSYPGRRSPASQIWSQLSTQHGNTHAQDQEHWKHLVETATLQVGACAWWRYIHVTIWWWNLPMVVFFSSTRSYWGMYLAILFYQPAKKLGYFFTRLLKKNG